ncbi:hypothetical protein J4446_00730 [Candidatus Woesearchaeota archaeon]|nr:hypothetical protein [Candidatus Woesearchaeota archaeon]
MFNLFERSSRKFLFWGLFFFLIVFLTFLFFHPKFYTEERIENLNYRLLDNEEIYRISLNELKSGDIILDKPISYGDRYIYQQQFDETINNRFIFFLYYNIFEFLIDSMGEGNYWHSFVYVGDGRMNSLSLKGVDEENFTIYFTNSYYFIVLRPIVSEEVRNEAIEKTNIDLKNKNIKYSFRNGLLIVFSRATGINLNYKIKDDELVCSSYAASLYHSLKFNGKDYKYATPIDLFDEDLTKIVMAKTRRGFYYGK